MQIGLDTFVTSSLPQASWGKISDVTRVEQMLEEVVLADKVGLDVYAVGEHHRPEYIASSPSTLLAAAAALTRRIILGSAVTVLSSDDPIRLFQQFSTVDLISKGRAEMIIGRGSFIESYPLFGHDLRDYDKLFSEKLSLLLAARQGEHLHWKGTHRPPLTGEGVYPRPVQSPLPVRIGVGGSPESFARAGRLGLPLVVAVIGGQVGSFRPLVDLYRESGAKAGHSPEQLQVGLHCIGFIGETTEQAADDFFPSHQDSFTRIGKERGWAPFTRGAYDAQRGPAGAWLIGGPEEMAEKMLRHSADLGGVDRISIVVNGGHLLPHEKVMHCIELLGTRVAPIVRAESAQAA